MTSKTSSDVDISLETRSARNLRQVALLNAGFGLIVFVIFAVILLLLGGGILGVVLAAAIALIWLGVAWMRAAEVVLDLSEVETANEKSHARLFNTSAGMCVAVGVAPPKLYVVEDAALNAMAVGRDAHHASLVVTTGLLDALSVVELEAVVTQELLRIKFGDIGPQTFLVPTVGAAAVLAESADRWQWLQKALMFPMPIVERVLRWLHTDRKDIDLDIATTLITKYPPALADALEKMDGKSALSMGAAVTAHLWMAPPLGLRAPSVLAKIHVPLAERVAVIREL